MKTEMGRVIELLEEIRDMIGSENPDNSLTPDALSARDKWMLNETYGLTDTASLQARADYNRENAARLFSDRLMFDIHAARYRERDTGELVMFTPYGWQTETDANAAISAATRKLSL